MQKKRDYGGKLPSLQQVIADVEASGKKISKREIRQRYEFFYAYMTRDTDESNGVDWGIFSRYVRQESKPAEDIIVKERPSFLRRFFKPRMKG